MSKKKKQETEADDNREKDQELDVQEVKELTDDELQKELKRFLIPKLRSASYRWKFRSQAIKNARVERGRYRCAQCGNSGLKNGEYAIDHVESVVPLDGWSGSWDVYIQRMFCKTEGFQLLCFSCHELKTNLEVQLRKIRREAKKKLNEKD